jgi:3-oxoacyl-[acyl-carrier protein] reductase
MEQKNQLSGQTAVVTGGASGIGKATCLDFARAGANVAVVDIDEEGVQRTIEQLDKEGGDNRAIGLVLSVCDNRNMDEMVRKTLDGFGRIDVLVSCAAILRPKGTSPKQLSTMTTEEWDAVLNTNLRGTFLANRAVLPTMIAQRKGHIINISSTSGRQGRAYDSAYCASKFGIIGLTESLAEEVRQHNIKVNAVLPDAVDTPLWRQNSPMPPPSDLLSPASIANFIMYLVNMPEDVTLVNPIITSFRTRRRKQL